MSGYIIEIPEEIPIFYNTDTNIEIIEYWKLYSKEQKKRFKKVLFQMLDVWNDVYNTINMMRNFSNINIEESNYFMTKIHKMFLISHKDKIEYYNNEKMKLRQQKNYLSKKIKKLRNMKNKI